MIWMDGDNPGFLVESALLSHGLVSVSDEAMLCAWPFSEKIIVWVEEGSIQIGTMEQFLHFRSTAHSANRIDCNFLPTAVSQGATGALTASGTMAVCQRMGIRFAVTCGIGGICDIEAEKLCPDLPALAKILVTLISAGPKDMVDVPATFKWLAEHEVTVCSVNQTRYTGYIFKSTNVPVQQVEFEDIVLKPREHLLIVNSIPDENKIKDLAILQAGVAAGKKAEAEGKYYHPAASAEFDRLTGGLSSKIQLDAMIKNVEIAQKLAALME
ncbi:MAG: pseudouridine-5'-phosphate glycosidase [Dehalococcoidales bacterium]|nr:pseudouridine-5'-phosphate glycosidase [Dehalococcoidales bacterium]